MANENRRLYARVEISFRRVEMQVQKRKIETHKIENVILCLMEMQVFEKLVLYTFICGFFLEVRS
jgi:hypothetical protein